MRHRKKLKRLGIKSSHRRQLMRNLAAALIVHGSIETTAIKAKALSPFVSRLITIAKKDETKHAIRKLDMDLHNEEASRKLMTELKKRYEHRSSGFIRLTPVKYRKGDNALVTRVELLS